MRSPPRRLFTVGVPLTLPATRRRVAGADPSSAAVLAAPVAGTSDDVAVAVEPRSFSGGARGDGVFFGLARGPRDLAPSRYDHRHAAPGVDVRVDGQGQCDDGTGGGRASTGWAERDGRWHRLRAPTPREVSGAGSPAVGVRLTVLGGAD
ncbi:hypothetical protein [Prauserella cavernicola]|uniref:Uncharacterized protein n=1 Tax=Prauserella cavernicola TaxID=2800127 RepID=A0A934QPP4_9PSEU|nr:hypothetical protein [Prauserella cavernicola]MBK1783134.1 hypothetical protein [Prauserella cavernicola]